MSIQIIIAEDHPLILAGIQFLLMAHKPEAVITCTSDFNKTIAMLEKRKFDLLIMDINLPGGDKVTMVHSVRLRQPDLPILVCSSYDEQLYAVPFLKAGANGYISKTAINDDFTKAVDHVLSGRTYASPEVMQHAFAKLLGSKETRENVTEKLSERELDVAQLLVKGQSTKNIGEQLSLSSSSISIYKSKIFEKLGVNNVIELTKYFQVND
ncbi:MAG TPA: response regulator transcription factor [Dyadobacter sp.]|nr:response regulator transcription factor [Dyadobacter sp.]